MQSFAHFKSQLSSFVCSNRSGNFSLTFYHHFIKKEEDDANNTNCIHAEKIPKTCCFELKCSVELSLSLYILSFSTHNNDMIQSDFAICE